MNEFHGGGIANSAKPWVVFKIANSVKQENSKCFHPSVPEGGEVQITVGESKRNPRIESVKMKNVPPEAGRIKTKG